MTVDVALCRKVADVADDARTGFTERNECGHSQMTWLSIPHGVYEKAAEAQDLPCWAIERVPLAAMQSCNAGGSACLAGWTAILTAPEGTETEGNRLYFPDGTELPIWEYARHELGLDRSQQDYVFHCLDAGAAVGRLRRVADEAEREQF